MLRTIDIRKTMTSLVFLCFWFSSLVTGGQIFSEVKAISGSPIEDGEGRLMRLRTCHDVFMVQCELCEAIRIVNASYAANRLQHRNPIQGCSGATFSQEFECLMSVKAQYFEAITESCDGIQSCQVTREGSVVSCGHSSKTWSCCMEIYYTCVPKNDQIQTVLFSANDLYGNVINVSLQCLDLSVDSVMWVFNSSREVNKGGVCYKVLPDTKDLKRRCERRGCSNVYVPGDSGCGGNENVFNNGLYVCYICKHNKVHKSTLITPTSALFGSTSFRQGLNSKPINALTQAKTKKTMASSIPSHGEARTTILSEITQSGLMIASSSTFELPKRVTTSETTESALTIGSNTSSPTTEPHLSSKVELRVIVFDSFVGALLLFLFVGCLVYANRRKNRAPASSRSTTSQSRKGTEPARESKSSVEEEEDYSYMYPGMPPICVQLKAGGKDHNYKLSSKTSDSDESRLQNESEHLDKVQAKQQVSTIWQVLPRVQDKLEETKIYNSKSNSNELTDYGTYLEFVADDAHEEGVGKGVDPVFAEKKEFKKSLEPIADGTKESDPLCVNADICREEPNIACDTMDFICMSPVYEELNPETMYEYPAN